MCHFVRTADQAGIFSRRTLKNHIQTEQLTQHVSFKPMRQRQIIVSPCCLSAQDDQTSVQLLCPGQPERSAVDRQHPELPVRRLELRREPCEERTATGGGGEGPNEQVPRRLTDKSADQSRRRGEKGPFNHLSSVLLC